LAKQGRALVWNVLRLAIGLLDRPGGTQDVVGRDKALLPGELIAAPRSPQAFEDALADQRLEHGLQMSRREPMTRCQGFGGDGPATGMQRDIDNGCDGKNAFARQERH
jgi:hypothetical protein